MKGQAAPGSGWHNTASWQAGIQLEIPGHRPQGGTAPPPGSPAHMTAMGAGGACSQAEALESSGRWQVLPALTGPEEVSASAMKLWMSSLASSSLPTAR